MAELLLELFSEEIPARMQDRARDDLARLLGDKLKAAGLDFGEIRTFATPRRLTAVVDGLPKRSPDVPEERKGPSVDAPSTATDGFLKSVGLESIDELERREVKKGEYYFASITRPGREASDVIAEIAPEIVRNFPWPKSMRWGEKHLGKLLTEEGDYFVAEEGRHIVVEGWIRWVRPLHSVLCLFDGKVVDFEIDGIKSGKETRGHRFMAPKPFAVKNFKDYVEKLKNAFVILDGEERAALILKNAKALTKKKGLTLVEDEGLLAENAGLTEWPVVLMGASDEDFLSVPPEVLATAMKAHQKCFSVRKGDVLASRFIVVANLEAKDGGKAITAGNERVIRARLADAKFFFDQDRKVSLEDRVPKLKEITFHEKLGTQYDRVQRIFRLAREIAPLVGADPDLAERAAVLAKADLVTDMVGEFPELQGVMGYYYALDQKENPSVAEAVAAHYKPVGPTDDVPRDPIAIAVALADKLDTLVGFWAIDEKPTGSKDPYALRRAALGVIRIILENGLRVHVVDLLESHWKRIDESRPRTKAHKSVIWNGRRVREATLDLLNFFADRLKVYLRDQGARYDLIDAVFALPGQDDLLMIVARVEALGRFLETDDGEHLLTGTKRAINILRIEEKNDRRRYDGAPDPNLMNNFEKHLWGTIQSTIVEAGEFVQEEKFDDAMEVLSTLRPAVDSFFETVRINVDERDQRENRLKLLNQIRAATLEVADLSKIAG